MNQCSKANYADKALAYLVAERREKEVPGLKLYVYWCGQCKSHHLTKTRQVRKAKVMAPPADKTSGTCTSGG